MDLGSRSAKVKVQLQLIDVATAENVEIFEAEGTSEAGSSGVDAGVAGVGAKTRKRTSVDPAAAARDAIHKAVAKLRDRFATVEKAPPSAN